MTRSWCDGRWQWKLVGWIAFVGIVAKGGDRTYAQVTADPSVGTTVTLNGDTFEITNGTTVGDKNLFHSFSNFSIPDGGTANFFNAPTIANILARVTGGNPSDIQGLIRAQGSANLFLMNPNGILFGPNAQLDLGGSFVATTANAIQFPGGAEFAQNSPVADNSLLSVNPSAFLFNQIAAQPITNQSVEGLQVPGDQSLLLLGGDVNLEGGRLFARGGRVELGGVAGVGTVGLNVDNNNLSLSFPNGVERTDVSLTNGSEVNVRAGGGSITINSQNLDILTGSRLRAGIESDLGFFGSQAGDITLNAIEAITVADENSFIANAVLERAVGNGGNVNITAGSLFVNNGGQVNSLTRGQGDTGSVNINARDSVSFNGVASNGDSAGSYSTVAFGAVGNGGSINITTDSLSVTNGAVLNASTFGRGNAGSVSVQARDSVSLSDSSYIRSNVEQRGVGNGGDIDIQTRLLTLTNGGQVQAVVFRAEGAVPGGKGKGGNIQVTATDFISMSGFSSNSFSSGLLTITEQGASGQAGDITVNTGDLRIANSANINAATRNASDGGNITINANTLEATGGGQVRATSRSSGKAGNISLNVTDKIILSGSDPTYSDRLARFGQDRASDAGSASGLFASTTEASTGQGGALKIITGQLFVQDDALVISLSEGEGNAGTIAIEVHDILQVNNGEISTRATLSGGGDITITASYIRLHGDSDIRTDLASSAGSGGNINLTANSIIAFDDSDILAFAAEGQGGNITLNTPVFFGFGYRPGASETDYAILDGNDRVDLNASGAIASGNITTPDTTFIQNSLTELPANVIDTGTLVANSCIARGSDRSTGSFIITGTGGLPTRPGDNTASSYPTGTVRSTSDRATDAIRSWKIGDPIVEPQGAYRLPNGQLVLSRECS